MTTFTTLSNTTLEQDKPVTQSVIRALRDNPVSIGEGDSTAPKVEHKAIVTGAAHITATPGGPHAYTANTAVPFTTAIANVNGWFNTSTYRYTPQRKGLYAVSVIIGITTAGTFTANIRKNGSATDMPHISVPGSGVARSPITTIIEMNGTTDYLDASITANCSIGGGEGASFNAALIAHIP